MSNRQEAYELRCEWGPAGLAALAPGSAVIVVVDVLSFTTCVAIATARGAVIRPFAADPLGGEARALDQRRAAEAGWECAAPRGRGRYSLSPRSLVEIPAGTRLLLPSPNGAALSLETGGRPTLAACLRNATAVALAAAALGGPVSVIPAGERWDDGSLRPCLEDWAGAGAVLAALGGRPSPEARAAVDVFRAARPDLAARLRESVSGRELEERGHGEDVELAAALDVSAVVPVLTGGAYRALESPPAGSPGSSLTPGPGPR